MLLIHGDNQLVSRKLYFDLKSQSPDPVTFSGSHNLTNIIQALESNTLFGASRSVFIEKPFSQKSAFVKDFTQYLKENKPERLVVWEDKLMGVTVTRLFAPEQIRLCKVSRSLYTFLEQISPGQQRQFLPQYLATLQQEPVELVLYYLFSQLRLLIQAKDNTIPTRIPGFIRTKATKQAVRFSLDKLVDLHLSLYHIDKANKTGTLHHTLEVAIENWLWRI